EKDLYERAKAIYGSDEGVHFLHNEVKDAVSMAQEAISAALGRLGDELKETARTVGLHAQMACMPMYADMHGLIFDAKLTLQQYLDLLSRDTFQLARKTGDFMRATAKEGGRVVRSVMQGGMSLLHLDDDRLRKLTMSVTFCLVVEGEIFEQAMKLKGQ